MCWVSGDCIAVAAADHERLVAHGKSRDVTMHQIMLVHDIKQVNVLLVSVLNLLTFLAC
jgi:hypothetical protein